MTVRVHTITVEARDPEALATFWSLLLGFVREPNHTDSVQIGDGQGLRLLFAPSDREKTTRNRIHLDLRPDDQGETVARAVGLGATVLTTGTESWVRLADPEGNEFCILQSQNDYDAFAARNPPVV